MTRLLAALRGLLHRAGISLNILLVAVMAVAAVTVGPAYFAAQSSVVQDTVGAAAAPGRGLEIRVGAESLAGQEYVVVGRDGTLQLPAELTDLFPPGSLARAERHERGVFLHQVDPPDPADPGGDPGPAGPPAPGAGR